LPHSTLFPYTTLFRSVIAHCKAQGSFNGDVADFCTAIHDRAAAGGTSQMVIEAGAGRFLNVIDKPLATGGWVTTLEDISEHRKRSEEHTSELQSLRHL